MTSVAARQARTLGEVRPLLDTVLGRLRERFGDDLVSVVVYGSYARGDAHEFSDVDLVVVLDEVPRDWDAIFALEHEVGLTARGSGKKVQAQVLSRDDVVCSVQHSAPMMLEVYDAHRVLQDRDWFFSGQMSELTALMRFRGIRRISRGLWEVPPYETRA